jgi:predicted RNase H-like HicB family nuclease
MAVKLTIETEREEDGRWIAEVLEIPGALAYGATLEEAVREAKAIAFAVLGDRAHRENIDSVEFATASYEGITRVQGHVDSAGEDPGANPSISAENPAQLRDLPGHKRRKPQPSLGFSVDAPGIETDLGEIESTEEHRLGTISTDGDPPTCQIVHLSARSCVAL